MGIRANARVGFLRAKTAPGQTKPNGCIVFLVLVSCSGQRRCGASAWGFRCVSMKWAKSFIVRHMMHMSIVSQIVYLGAFGAKVTLFIYSFMMFQLSSVSTVYVPQSETRKHVC